MTNEDQMQRYEARSKKKAVEDAADARRTSDERSRRANEHHELYRAGLVTDEWLDD